MISALPEPLLRDTPLQQLQVGECHGESCHGFGRGRACVRRQPSIGAGGA